MNPVTILPVPIAGEVAEGSDIAALIASSFELQDDDIVVVTQKIVSKAEGRKAVIREEGDKRRISESESIRILRRRGDFIIAETRHGFVCASAGVDSSNVEPGQVLLLPVDPDLSARRIRSKLGAMTGKDVAVIISDTFGRAWRNGQTNVAIGVAGMLPLLDYAGTTDTFGNVLRVTNIAVADEMAGAAELVMGKAEGIPVAIIRGATRPAGRGNARQLVRPATEDLFR